MMENLNLKKLSILIFICLFFYYPLITANVYYRDDLDRVISGYYGWSSMGRPLADFVSQFLSNWTVLSIDVFPLNLFLSCLFLAFSSYVICNKILDKYKINNSLILSSIILINPLFIQNMLYRFDSTSMSLAILFAALAYCVEFKSVAITYISKILLSVVSLSLYQPCYNLFMGLIALEIICATIKNNNVKNIFIITAKGGFYFLLSYIIYMITVAKIYVTSSRAEIIKPNEDGIKQIIKTNENLIGIINTYVDTIGINQIIFLSIAFFISLILSSIKRNDVIKKISFILLSILIIYVSFLGPTMVLKDAPVMARGIVTIPVLFMISLLFICEVNRKFKIINYIIIIIVLTPMISFSYYTGNAIKNQREYEDNIFSMINYDLLNKANFNIEKVMITGSLGVSPASRNIVRMKPLVSSVLSNVYGFQSSYLLTINGVKNVEPAYGKDNAYRELIKESMKDSENIISQNEKYSIYKNNSDVIIKLGM